MKRFLCSLAFLIPLTVLGQTNPNSITLTPIHGLNVTTPFESPLKGYIYGGQVSYNINMGNNQSPWTRALHVRDVSIDATYLNMQRVSVEGMSGTTGVLGASYGIGTTLNMEAVRFSDMALLICPGFGLDYSTQDYGTTSIPIVGSHVNFVIHAAAKIEAPMSQSIRLQFGLLLTHRSNVSFQPPNTGLNMLQATVGVVKDLGTQGPTHGVSYAGNSDQRHSFEFSFAGGKRGFVKTGYFWRPDGTGSWDDENETKKQESAPGLYHFNLYAGYNYRLSRLLGLKIGTDATYYTQTFSWDRFFTTYEKSFTSYDRMSVGVSAGTDLWLGRLAISESTGYYLHYKGLTPQRFYWSFGAKYFLNSWLAVTAKTYLHQSEPHYPSFGMLVAVR